MAVVLAATCLATLRFGMLGSTPGMHFITLPVVACAISRVALRVVIVGQALVMGVEFFVVSGGESYTCRSSLDVGVVARILLVAVCLRVIDNIDAGGGGRTSVAVASSIVDVSITPPFLSPTSLARPHGISTALRAVRCSPSRSAHSFLSSRLVSSLKQSLISFVQHEMEFSSLKHD